MPSTPRNISDAALTITTAIPAQNTNANTAAIDLGQALSGPAMDMVEVLVTLPAQATMTTGQTITAKLQDSADNTTFADLPLGSLVQTGASSAGPLTVGRYKLNPAVRRYLRINVASSATAGDSIGGNSVLKLVF